MAFTQGGVRPEVEHGSREMNIEESHLDDDQGLVLPPLRHGGNLLFDDSLLQPFSPSPQ